MKRLPNSPALRVSANFIFYLSSLVFCACQIGCSTPSDTQVISQAEQTHQTLAPAIEQDPQIDNYFTQIGRRIQAAAQQCDAEHVGPKAHFAAKDDWMFQPNIQFHLVNSKTLNAFTTGGQHVYVYGQLLATCTKEEDLAAVMSHEFAHIYCRHVASGMQRSEKQQYLAIAASGAGYVAGGSDTATSFASMAMAAGQYIGMGFTRKDEAQADQYGFKFYTRAGWDPTHFADFFQTMINLGYDKTPAELSDHPTLASRVAKAKQYVASLPPDTAKYQQPDIFTPSQFEQIQQVAQQVAARTPSDEQLQSAQKLLNAFPSCVASEDSPDQKQAQELIFNLTHIARPTTDAKNKYEAQAETDDSAK